jgi:inorganic triphosphatase YgiF
VGQIGAAKQNNMRHPIHRHTDFQLSLMKQQHSTLPHVKVMDFPKFPPYERDKWDKLGWTFAQTVAASDHFHLLERQRVATFLKEFTRAIDALNLWHGTLTQEETAKLTQAKQLQEKTKTRKSSTKNSASDKSEQSTKTTLDTSKIIEKTNQEVAHVQS